MEFDPKEYKVTIRDGRRLQIYHNERCKWLCTFQAQPDPTVTLGDLIEEAHRHHTYRHEKRGHND